MAILKAIFFFLRMGQFYRINAFKASVCSVLERV
jgi:hypothetical protein